MKDKVLFYRCIFCEKVSHHHRQHIFYWRDRVKLPTKYTSEIIFMFDHDSIFYPNETELEAKDIDELQKIYDKYQKRYDTLNSDF